MLQRTSIFFGAGNTAALNLDVGIRNATQEEIIVRRVRIDPSLMTQWSVYPQEKVFKETLAPGQGRALSMYLSAYTNVSRLMPTEPLSLRATIDYDAGDKHYREYYIQSRVGE